MIYRKFVSVLMFSLIGIYAIAQDDNSKMQTLFGDGIVSYGGYGGPRVAYSSFNGKDAWLVGGRGGAILNHQFVLGGAGYGIVNSPKFNNIDGNSVAYLEGGYGGLLIEYIFKPLKVVHLSFPLVVGGGALMYTDTPSSGGNHDFNQSILSTSTFFVVEPGVELEINVIRFMRISAGVSYRYAHNLKLPDTPTDAFNTLSGTLSLKFGRF